MVKGWWSCEPRFTFRASRPSNVVSLLMPFSSNSTGIHHGAHPEHQRPVDSFFCVRSDIEITRTETSIRPYVHVKTRTTHDENKNHPCFSLYIACFFCRSLANSTRERCNKTIKPTLANPCLPMKTTSPVLPITNTPSTQALHTQIHTKFAHEESPEHMSTGGALVVGLP